MSKSEKKHIQLTIRQKLMLSYSVLVLLMLLLGGAGFYSTYRIYSSNNDLYEQDLHAIDSLRQTGRNVQSIGNDLLRLYTGTGVSSDYVYEILVLQTQNDRLMQDIAQHAKQNEALEQLRSSIESYNSSVNAALEQLEADELPVIPSEAELLSLIDAMTTQCLQSADHRNTADSDIVTELLTLSVGLCLGAALIAVVISFYMSNHFTRRLDIIRSFAKRMAEYDISDDIRDTTEDEIGKTMTALNDSQFMIRDLLEKIISDTSDMTDMGTDISHSLRKTGARLQTVSMLIMKAEELADQMDSTVSGFLSDIRLEEPAAEKLRQMLHVSEEARAMLDEAMGEMSSIETHLEQIAVTSDYQNELSDSNRELISRFRLRPSETKQEGGENPPAR